MNLPQSATVDGLDYEKPTSKFVTHLLAYHRRTGAAIGAPQLGNLERGLLSCRAELVRAEQFALWQSMLDAVSGKIVEIKRRYQAGEIAGDVAMAQAEILEKITGVTND